MKKIETICFDIPGKPVPKGRPRINMRSARIYTPKTTVDAEIKIRQYLLVVQSIILNKYRAFQGGVELCLGYYFPFPSTIKKSERINGLWHRRKPDLDNLVKLTVDAFNGYLYKDDNQIFCIKAGKVYDYCPHTEVKITYFE